jgi:hypothetical protein
MAGILEYYNKVDIIEEAQTEIKSIKEIKIRKLEDKQVFLENWFISYPSWGEQYGRTLSIEESCVILDSLNENKVDKKLTDLESILDIKQNIGNPIVLIMHRAMLSHFSKVENFVPSWRIKEKLPYPKEFQGYFQMDKKMIPLYYVMTERDEKDILVMDINDIGKLARIKRVSQKGNESNTNSNIYLEINGFKNNSKLLNEFLQKIKNTQTTEEKTLLLEKMVVVEVSEKIELGSIKEAPVIRIPLEGESDRA